ncbi:methylated-DNA--[protein]-cysteine S-methyltransferase [Pseudoglutamicibacter cumminsii]|uniref:methylated-DNA--[protein]-cysteine S-methyltransferase n=1 Tax=Pseudoglutamicibacter cumminsii TaxID=156979 RepID=UPI00195AD8B1|nr:methylated-DNA--[protein]-cysteine S-methyltransferase [Pseudoglutamicibacter cumminsii]MBM7796568.1 methylated-DNA-[protein]-cysteine S-methyltransferase [Pseudoglutamicibacter cumminsii]
MTNTVRAVAAVAELSTAIGTLVVSSTPTGIAHIDFKHRMNPFVEEGMARLFEETDRTLRDRAQAWADMAVEQIDEYFMLERDSFDVPLDGPHGNGFRETVQRALARIPYGSTITYAELAEMAGNPDAVRAAGTACATNPLPLLLPCHRVVRTDGRMGAYLGGELAKKHLLRMEAEGLVEPGTGH